VAGGEGDGSGDRRGIRLPLPCRSYAAGHHPHRIQWKQAFRDPDTRAAAEVVSIGIETFSIVGEGGTIELWNHDLERLALIVDRLGPEIVTQFRWGVIWVDTYLISVSRRGPLTPCPTEEAGGATVRATTEEETASRLLQAVRGAAPGDGG
jgi:hypothetical protein